ncbi:hypothetical protein RclHR1_14130007 [Rhizophagus clarus]|uniref:NADP-dependent oxidoreductase domain-containing protein n=1 Tax=Rhizophagus clarus TaxID=94130 RepID=A0A2Z6R4G0_9GLOM|nr:hypothetical protein RclHR1_14130007 [Rhizophagus clarus]
MRTTHIKSLCVQLIVISDFYGPADEQEILKERRDEVFLCIKYGIVRVPSGEITGISGKSEYIRQSCENSLKRLGIKCIDLYYQHRIDPNTPIEDTVSALAKLVKEGKAKYIGLSECSAETLRRTYKVHPIAAIQEKYKSFDDFAPDDWG